MESTLSILILFTFVIASFLWMFGATRKAKRLIIAAILLAVVGSIVSAWLSSLLRHWPSWSWLPLIVLVGLVVILLFYRRLGRFVLAFVLVYVRLSYRLGVRIVEFLIRFPPVLLPLPERLLVILGSVLLAQALLVLLVAALAGAHLSQSLFLFLALPLLLSFVFGFLGKWRYLRRERRGLANV